MQELLYNSFDRFAFNFASNSPNSTACVLALADYKEALSAWNFFDFFYKNPRLAPSFAQKNPKTSESAPKDSSRDFEPLKPFLLPEVRAHFGEDLSPYREDLLSLLQTLREFYDFSGKKILCAPISSILYPLPKPILLSSFYISKQSTLSPQALFEKLLEFGYESVEVVELSGEVSMRGEIMDIFMPSFELPYRICFFGDNIESIRVFEPSTQISKKDEFDELQIPPSFFNTTSLGVDSDIDSANFQNSAQSLWNLGENGVLLHTNFSSFITSSALGEAREIASLQKSIDEQENFTQENLAQEVSTQAPDSKNIQSTTPPCALDYLADFILLDSQNTSKNNESVEITFSPKMLESLLSLHSQKDIILLAPNMALLKSHGLDFSQIPPKLESRFQKLGIKNIQAIICPHVLNLLTPTKLFLSFNTLESTKKARKRHSKLLLNELNIGEYIVHSDYGVGIFKGLKSVSVLGVVRDFIEIAYQGEDKLLLPVDKLELIERFVADSGSIPVIDRLGKGSFAKLKESVRKKLLEIASGIIELAAKRELTRGIKVDCQNALLQKFSQSAPFELTEDQERSIDEIFKDLESGRVMDRLLSGDVGFGKTEVAMNAMCALILQGYQCAFLAPTTLLSSQHFSSLSTRFDSVLKSDGNPIKIAKIDRFVSTKEKAHIAQELRNGKIDIVIGTHALLGLEFYNLGLVVIDEEHKFGVKQKEKIKSLCADTHLLSMSATPIPRTLNMALSKIKGFSTLRTPPLMRKGVRTFLKPHNNNLVREVIMRELRRGGQVFYIHNNIASIESKKKELLALLPNLSIAVLHSQIDNVDSEDIMQGFLQGKSQVLLCTSIVESGLHLPNANTIIIEEANRFGIADLHQLRGRVGRGNREGFCYLLVRDEDSLGDEAKKRLSALEKNSYLGSGENLAYHDLEIRGGGNLLGAAQSGHIKKIGYGLYLSMLEECVNKLSGQGEEKKSQVDLKINLSAYLNPELIASDKLRLELYRRLCLCAELSEVYEIEGEIENRFGKIDELSLSFLEQIRIRVLANKLKLKQITHFGQNISFTYENGEKKSFQSASKDWDDVLGCIMQELRKELKSKG